MSVVMPVVDSDGLPVTGQFTLFDFQGSQMSHLSSMQLLPNRVRLDFNMDAVDFVSCVCGVSEIRWGSTPSVTNFVTGVAFVVCITGCGLSTRLGG